MSNSDFSDDSLFSRRRYIRLRWEECVNCGLEVLPGRTYIYNDYGVGIRFYVAKKPGSFVCTDCILKFVEPRETK